MRRQVEVTELTYTLVALAVFPLGGARAVYIAGSHLLTVQCRDPFALANQPACLSPAIFGWPANPILLAEL